jgi:hypothetical protein
MTNGQDVKDGQKILLTRNLIPTADITVSKKYGQCGGSKPPPYDEESSTADITVSKDLIVLVLDPFGSPEWAW